MPPIRGEMERYTLRFAIGSKPGEKTVAFFAHSTAQALDLAKESASGNWAELYHNDRSICRMRLVEDTGVWLVQHTGPNAQKVGRPVQARAKSA